MTNRARAAGIPSLGAIAETIDRGFDWGSAAIGGGVGAAVVLLLVAVTVVVRSRGTGSHSRGGDRS